VAAGQQWFLVLNGAQAGPFSQDDVVARLRAGQIDKATLVFTQGMSQWTPLVQVPELASAGVAAGAGFAVPPPPPGAQRAHEIAYKVYGEDLQFVEVELDPRESVVAEAGAMMYMTPGVEMETIFGDGSGTQKPGFMGALLGAGKRLLTGESLFMTVFTNTGAMGIAHVAFAAPYPGRILAMDLKKLGGELVCQKDSFLCAAKGISIGIAFQKKIGVGLFGGEGFIMQRLQGDGLAFVHAGGMLHELQLKPGETLRVDTGCLVALQPTVSYDIQLVGGVKTALFGGEGLFFATLTGPGHVWLQSLPFSRLADRIAKAIPGVTGAGRREEGSVLGGLGNLLDGD
jgi:uncharacterized protein (TIGR00266 family)